METLTPPLKCKDCRLCRLDLTKKVVVRETYDDNMEAIVTDYADHAYCGHLVTMVGPDWDACDFIKPRSK